MLVTLIIRITVITETTTSNNGDSNNKKKNTTMGLYRDSIRGYIGVYSNNENKMETTIMGYVGYIRTLSMSRHHICRALEIASSRDANCWRW